MSQVLTRTFILLDNDSEVNEDPKSPPESPKDDASPIAPVVPANPPAVRTPSFELDDNAACKTEGKWRNDTVSTERQEY